MQNPRTENDNLGTMHCFHRRYTLGDNASKTDEPLEVTNKLIESLLPEGEFEAFETLPAAELAMDMLPIIFVPLWMYDHSGITMASTPFSCPWDSGRIGYIYVLHTDLKKELGVEHLLPTNVETARATLEAEVKEYDKYISGDYDDG